MPINLPKLTVTIPTRKVSQTSPQVPKRLGSPDFRHLPLKKISSNAIFNIQDVIVNTELSNKIDVKKWVNQANIVTPEFKKSTFMSASGASRRSFDVASSNEEDMLHCKKNLNFDVESFGGTEEVLEVTPEKILEVDDESSDEGTSDERFGKLHLTLEQLEVIKLQTTENKSAPEGGDPAKRRKISRLDKLASRLKINEEAE